MFSAVLVGHRTVHVFVSATLDVGWMGRPIKFYRFYEQYIVSRSVSSCRSVDRTTGRSVGWESLDGRSGVGGLVCLSDPLIGRSSVGWSVGWPAGSWERVGSGLNLRAQGP